MVRGHICYSVGNPQNPGDPWGRSDLEIDTDGTTRLAHQSRQGEQAWSGRFTALEELFAALESAGFPDVPRHPVPAGATVCTLSIGDSTAYIERHAARKMPGYGDAFRLLETAIRQLSGDTVDRVPSGPPVVTDVAVWPLEARLETLNAAVIADPEADAPRLAYANAAEPARAELIRTQIAIARFLRAGTKTPDGLPEGAHGRARELVRKDGARWASDLSPFTDWWVFVRGFVEWVRLDAAAFLACAPDLYRRAPIQHLDLTNVRRGAADLFASPHLAPIKSLNLTRNELGDAEVALLACSPHLHRLRWLDLSLNKIGEAGVEALAGSKLPLVYVCLTSNKVEDPTPQHGDEYDADSEYARKLMAKYGERAWLSVAAARTRPFWPPEREEF